MLIHEQFNKLFLMEKQIIKLRFIIFLNNQTINIRIFKRNNKSSVINVKMVEYNKVNVRLSDTQLKKLKNAVKNKTRTTLRINSKMFNGNNLPHELLLTTR